MDFPWTKSLNGKPITKESAPAYMDALKAYVANDMITMLSDSERIGEPSDWNAASSGWYNEPWLSSIRGGIHGVYLGSTCFSPVLFPRSNLKSPFTTYVYVLYNKIAGISLGKVWSASDGMIPDFANNAAQFPEGTIIVKAAFNTASKEDWAPMDGALPWNVYTQKVDCSTQKKKSKPEVFPVNFFQFDLIVKDTVASPQTGWVFGTLTYDKDKAVPSKTVANIWNNQMVVLGAMWGNDPDVIDPGLPLSETWINPEAPIYAKETLGWGGRLSGPNDGAVQNPPYTIYTGTDCTPDNPCQTIPAEKVQLVGTGGKNIAMSSCMSCHSTAQYAMRSFLLPTLLDYVESNGTPVPTAWPTKNGDDGLLFYQPASYGWMTWFQNRIGDQPKDPGVATAADYDMNFPFKSLAYWATNVCGKDAFVNPSAPPACNELRQQIKTRNLELGSSQTMKTPERFEVDYQGREVLTMSD